MADGAVDDPDRGEGKEGGEGEPGTAKRVYYDDVSVSDEDERLLVCMLSCHAISDSSDAGPTVVATDAPQTREAPASRTTILEGNRLGPGIGVATGTCAAEVRVRVG